MFYTQCFEYAKFELTTISFFEAIVIHFLKKFVDKKREIINFLVKLFIFLKWNVTFCASKFCKKIIKFFEFVVFEQNDKLFFFAVKSQWIKND